MSNHIKSFKIIHILAYLYRVTPIVAMLVFLVIIKHASASILFQDSFDDGNDYGWTVVEGSASVVDGHYRLNGSPAKAWVERDFGQQYRFEVDFQYVSGGFSICVWLERDFTPI